MSDAADFAAELVAAEIAAGLARIDRTIPIGAPGECDECGETMPRLVGGRCGFCRDGRRPPIAVYDRLPAPPITPVQPPAKEPVMANAKPSENFQVISIRARDEVLAALMKRAKADDVSLAQAALELITDTLNRQPDRVEQAEPTLRDLMTVELDDLLQDVRRRVAESVPPEEYQEANARANAAEHRAQAAQAKFDRLRAALAEVD